MEIMLISKNITEREFWSTYLKLLNALNPSEKKLNDKDIEIVSYMLTLDLKISYFTKSKSKVITKSIDNASYSELTRIKKKLLEYKLLSEHSNPDDLRSKNYYFHEQFTSLKRIFKNKKSITFKLNYNLDE